MKNSKIKDSLVFTRETLYSRHRISHQQINIWLGEQQNQLVFEEKLHQLNLLAGFLSIADNLQKENIWFIPLKGSMLSYRIYGDATCRRYRDFDILVKPEDVHAVIQLFVSWGFEYDKVRWPVNGTGKAKVISKVNQLTLYHSQKQQTVEIHWRVFIDPVIEFNRVEEMVQENIQKFTFAGREMNRFNLEFELLYLIIHGGLHAWRRLKWLIDVHEIISRFQISRNKFEELVISLDAQRMVGLCNDMLGHFFPGSPTLPIDFPVPGWFFKYTLLQVNRVEEQNYDIPSYSIKHRWFYIYAFSGWKYKQKRFYLLVSSLKKLPHFL